MGRDNLKFGAEFRMLRGYSQQPGFDAGNFTFDQTFTGANPLAHPALLRKFPGVVSAGHAAERLHPGEQPAGPPGEASFPLYVQNDIRVTPKLKVNLGLRWDYLGPLTDRFNELARGFNTTVASPLQAPGLSLNGGLLFTGVDGQPRGIFDASHTQLRPARRRRLPIRQPHRTARRLRAGLTPRNGTIPATPPASASRPTW